MAIFNSYVKLPEVSVIMDSWMILLAKYGWDWWLTGIAVKVVGDQDHQTWRGLGV